MLNDIQKASLKKNLSNFNKSDLSTAYYMGREFGIDRDPNGGAGFLPYEFRLTGFTKSGVKQLNSQLRKSVKKTVGSSPNDIAKELTDQNVDINTMHRVYQSMVSTPCRTFEQAIEMIYGAIEQNINVVPEPVVTVDVRTPERKRSDEIMLKKDSIAYFEGNLINTDIMDKRSLFAGNLDGLASPLSDDSRKRILSYLNKPSLDAWNDIRSILITPSFTIWQMTSRFKSNFPTRAIDFTEGNIPTKDELVEVMLQSVIEHNKEQMSRIEELKNELKLLECK